jgi:mycothiol synthase
LLDAMEARARERAVPGAVIRAVADEGEDPYRRLLEARGYKVVRASFRMAVEFDGPPPAPELPEGLAVRPYRAGEEERAVHAAVTDAFSDGWDHTPLPYEEFLHWATTANSDPALWWVALDGERIAGVCLCRPTAQGDEARGWVESLGVLRPWRGRGLGRALLLIAFGEFHQRGQSGAALSVDTENVTGAVRLYEGVGMHVTRRLDTYERPLDG